MTQEQIKAIAAIVEQQKAVGEFTTPWMVGEQLKDICTQEPDKAELIAHDLTIPEMSLDNAERKIKAWADKHKKGNSVGVPPCVAEGILREFYGLGKPGERTVASVGAGVALSLDDYL